MNEIRRHRTEITIETLSVTTIKKRETVLPIAYCTNCGHGITDFELAQREPVIDDNPRMITAQPQTGEVL